MIRVDSSPSIIIKWNSVGGTQIVISRIKRDSTSLDKQLFKNIFEKTGWEELPPYRKIRSDFIQFQYLKEKNASRPDYVLIQKDKLISIELINYGRWTGNGRNQHFIDTIDRGLNMIVDTMRTKD